MAFRSIVVSATAAVTTILSAFVGFGVLTLVVQEGHLLGLTGLDKTGPIETFVPPIAFAILFGLSMDYMVFIMSRIREEHVHGLGTTDAVAHGISAIGRVVVAAALIMGTVFAAFILSADRIPKEFGLLLAVAILGDALIVRMTLVPSFFTLLGERTWYIPRWLDRLLPNITIEAPHGDGGEAVGVEARPDPVAPTLMRPQAGHPITGRFSEDRPSPTSTGSTTIASSPPRRRVDFARRAGQILGVKGGAIDRDQLRGVQEPLKERYREEPATAVVTLTATGTLGAGITCSVATGRAIARSGTPPGEPAATGRASARATCSSRRWLPAPG